MLYALDALSGLVLWQYAPYSHFAATGCVANDIVYTVTDYPISAVHAVNATTGNVIWVDTFTMRRTPLTSAPVIFKKTVFINIQARVYAIDALTGIIRWQKSLGGLLQQV